MSPKGTRGPQENGPQNEVGREEGARGVPVRAQGDAHRTRSEALRARGRSRRAHRLGREVEGHGPLGRRAPRAPKRPRRARPARGRPPHGDGGGRLNDYSTTYFSQDATRHKNPMMSHNSFRWLQKLTNSAPILRSCIPILSKYLRYNTKALGAVRERVQGEHFRTQRKTG